MKELELKFTGKGQVKGFEFNQIKANDKAFIYEVKTENSIHYEVFQRKENTQYNCISYPSDKAFGLWAFTYTKLSLAIDKFNLLNNTNEQA